MAKKLTGSSNGKANGAAGAASSSQGANKGHNVKARDEAIREAMEAHYQKDKEIERLIAEHLADLRQDKRDIKKRMAKDYEISATMFNARYAPYRIERKARDNGDDTVADALKELWQACPPGGTVDLVAAAEAASSKAAAQPSA